MNTELALSLIESRMRDMGYKPTDYSTAFKHCTLEGNETREIEAYNEFYFLEHTPRAISIQSDFGYFDMTNTKTNEQKYEHQGFILIRNFSSSVNHVRFIQIVLKHHSNKHEHGSTT